jgi:carboxypeptidase D
VEQNHILFRFNQSFMSQIKATAQAMGYFDYLKKYLTYPPPPGPFPPPNDDGGSGRKLWSVIKQAITLINPCFNIYQIATTCPLLWDVLGFPGSFEYNPPGTSIYFDREDVKKAINAPTNVRWAECNNIPLSFADSSEPSSWRVLPRIIEKSERTIIGHGSLDFILQVQGSLLTIQNMTWGGKQGFQTPPVEEFFVPYHKEFSLSTISGAGVQGIVHTERKLTWVEVFLSGHMIPQYTPSAAYRQLEFLLGRISSLEDRTPFTTDGNSSSVVAAEILMV